MSDSVLEDSIDSSDMEAGTGAGGRPPHPIRKQFKKLDGPGTGKSKRKDYECNYCGEILKAPQPPACITHLQNKCKKVSQAIRDEIMAENAGRAPVQEAPTESKKEMKASKKRSFGQLTMDSVFTPAAAFTQAEHQALDHQLLWMIINCGISFRFLDSPYWLAFIHTASGGRYWPAGKQVAVHCVCATL